MPITVLKAKGVYAEDTALFYCPPVTRYLAGVHITNTDGLKAARNFAPGLASGLFVGTPPAVTADDISLVGQSAYIQTEIGETARMTFFAAIKSAATFADAANTPVFFSSGAAPAISDPGVTSHGITLSGTAGTVVGSAATGTSSSTETSISVPVASWAAWNIIEFQVDTTQLRMTNHTTGVTATPVSLPGPRLASSGKFRLGSGHTDARLGTCKMSYWQPHKLVLNSTEVAQTLAAMRALLATHAITA